MQKDLYTQALIDAKAVRASATAIAKASLQEAFAPQISELVRQSLAEEVGEIEELEEIEEGDDHKMEEGEDHQPEESDELEESTLEEILAELEVLEEDETVDPTKQADPGTLDEEYNELEEAEEDETDETETEEEDDIEDDEIDAEAPEMGEEDEEIVITFGQLKQALAPFMGGEAAPEKTDLDLDEILGEEADKHEEEKEAEMEEARKTIEELSSTLNEVNLLNAKLLYMNKLFKAKSLSEAQKQKVVSAFDRATSVKETKNIYATLSESIAAAPKKQLKESIGYASKPAGYAPKTQIAEADPFISRMQRLAGIN